jgi:DNA-directed RNA polymerase II subunit RPB1
METIKIAIEEEMEQLEKDRITLKELFPSLVNKTSNSNFLMLASKKVLFKYKMSENLFLNIISKIEDKFNKSIVHPGEMVGVIAAQSISETISVVTFETSKNGDSTPKALKVDLPRIIEIINKNTTKSPSMALHIIEPQKHDEKFLMRISHDLIYTRLKYITFNSEIIFEKDHFNSVFTESYPID